MRRCTAPAGRPRHSRRTSRFGECWTTSSASSRHRDLRELERRMLQQDASLAPRAAAAPRRSRPGSGRRESPAVRGSSADEEELGALQQRTRSPSVASDGSCSSAGSRVPARRLSSSHSSRGSTARPPSAGAVRREPRRGRGVHARPRGARPPLPRRGRRPSRPAPARAGTDVARAAPVARRRGGARRSRACASSAPPATGCFARSWRCSRRSPLTSRSCSCSRISTGRTTRRSISSTCSRAASSRPASWSSGRSVRRRREQTAIRSERWCSRCASGISARRSRWGRCRSPPHGRFSRSGSTAPTSEPRWPACSTAGRAAIRCSWRSSSRRGSTPARSHTRSGRWSVAQGVDVLAQGVPDTVRSLIEHQSAALAPASRTLIEAASVAGAEFATATAAAAAGVDEDEAESRLREVAVGATFVTAVGEDGWPDGTISTRYRFNHDLWYETLQESLPTGQRARLHRRIGDRLESAYEGRTDEIATELAWHFLEGREPGRAVRHLHAAAARSLELTAHREAIAAPGRGARRLARHRGRSGAARARAPDQPPPGKRDDRHRGVVVAGGGVVTRARERARRRARRQRAARATRSTVSRPCTRSAASTLARRRCSSSRSRCRPSRRYPRRSSA